MKGSNAMKKIVAVAVTALIAAAFPALAQPAPAPPAPAAPAPAGGGRGAQAPLQIPNPRYETVSVSVAVNASADTAWARVSAFCAIGGESCKYLSGNGEPGTVRSINNEVLVGTTQHSYTYAQAPRANTLYNFQHGTLQAIPVSATTSRLTHVVFFDTSMLADDAARAKLRKDLEADLNQKLQGLKTLAEGGKPATARAVPVDSALPPFQNPNPRYVAVPMQVAVNAPADVVWSRIGHFCDIGRIGAVGFPTCQIVEGTDGEYGVVRSVAREVLVGKAANSYTYAQQMRTTGFYALYHGTIEARAVTPTTSTLYWTLVFDNSTQPDDAAIARDIANRRTRFLSMMNAVKTLAEGGTLPETPAPTAPANRP
jgi:hypothetical protein